MPLAAQGPKIDNSAVAVPEITASVDVPLTDEQQKERYGDYGFSSGPEAVAPHYDATTLRRLKDLSRIYAQLARDTYPMIVRALHAEHHYLPKTITITISYKFTKAVAETLDDRIVVNDRYALDRPSDIGLIVHEMTHAVQQYSFRGEHPTWLSEGIADYVRYYYYEPLARRPHTNRTIGKATGSYMLTAEFLDWAQRTYNGNLVSTLNEQLYKGKYSDESWKALTGKSLDQLNGEWVASLPPG